jgi:hypothetical protein
MAAGPSDRVNQTGPAERKQRRPNLDAARLARLYGRKLRRIAPRSLRSATCVRRWPRSRHPRCRPPGGRAQDTPRPAGW